MHTRASWAKPALESTLVMECINVGLARTCQTGFGSAATEYWVASRPIGSEMVISKICCIYQLKLGLGPCS